MKRSNLISTILMGIVFLFLVFMAVAWGYSIFWTPNGVRIARALGKEYVYTHYSQYTMSDGAGGMIFAFVLTTAGAFPDCTINLYAQRINSSGQIMWPTGSPTTDGVAICTAGGNPDGQDLPSITSDGAGGAIIAWYDKRSGLYDTNDIYAQKINSNGVTQWTTNGVIVSAASGNQWNPIITSDGSGGAIISWLDDRAGSSIDRDIYAQRIDSNGSIHTGWPADGLAICLARNNQEDPQIASDGSGGAIITWHDYRLSPGSYDIWAQRVNGDGQILWPTGSPTTDSVAICLAPYTQTAARIASDGSGGAIIAWNDERYLGSNNNALFAQRINASGQILWPTGSPTTDGVSICSVTQTIYYLFNHKIINDGSGGAIIAWNDGRNGGPGLDDIYAQRINASGTVQWTANGVAICNATKAQTYPSLISDNSGGAIIAWGDRRYTTSEIFAQRIDSNGSVHSGWTANGVLICNATGNQVYPSLVSNGTNGAIIDWVYAPDSSHYDILAQKISDPPPPPPSAPTGFIGTAESISSIKWSWTNVASEDGYSLHDAAHAVKGATAANVTTTLETGLSANTQYTRHVNAYNSDGSAESGSDPRYTLSLSPNVTCDKTVDTWYNASSTFTFTNAAGFGAGGVQYYRYAWDNSAAHTWEGTETQWTSGTLPLTATSDGSWYLHVKSYNGDDAANGTADHGPYKYDGTVLAPIGLIATPDSWTKTNNFTLNWTNPSDASGIVGAYYKLDATPESSIDGTYKTPANYQFTTKWGSYGTEDGQFFYPMGVAVYSSGYVYIADTYNHRIQKFTSNGGFITKWGSAGTGDSQFNNPGNIAVDPSGNVYVADEGNYRIQKFDSNGGFITKWGSAGKGDGEFYWPAGVAIGPSGNVYVVDMQVGCIQKFTSTGTFILKWGSKGSGDGQFDSPWGIAVDSSENVYVAEGNVYVEDGSNNRIQKFNSNGGFITAWGSLGTGEGQFTSPTAVAVDSSGNIYVADRINNRIQKFNSNGGFITKWGEYGPGDSEFMYPYGIAVDSSGYVYVADSNNYRIQKFGALPLTQISGLTVTGEGAHPVYVWLKDNAGNLDYTNRATANLKLDTTAPSNPTACDGWSDKNKTTGISSGETYDYNNPYFEWSNASDAGSGVAGYHVYYGTNGAADPATAGAYQDPVSYEVTSPMTPGQTYHLRIKTKDNAGNTATNTYEAFSYIKYLAASSYTTKVGSNEEWSWKNSNPGDKVPSGTIDDWFWRTWGHNSGRKVPSGEAHDWIWGEE